MAIWLDYSGRFPGVAALKAVRITGQPVEGLLRYIGLGGEGKQIHRAEHDALIAAGFRIGLVAELGTGDAWDGLDDYATGRARAQVALDDMRREAPRAEFICCAADAHASSAAQISDAVQYAGGFQSVLGWDFSGFYGFSETSRAVHAAGLCRVHWRCGSKPSIEDQKWVNFWQRNDGAVVVNGTTCDINETYAPLTTQEDDMTPEQERMLYNLDAVNGALAFGYPDVTLKVRQDATTVVDQVFPTSQFRAPVDPAALAAALASPVAAELVKLGVAGASAQTLAAAFTAAAERLRGQPLGPDVRREPATKGECLNDQPTRAHPGQPAGWSGGGGQGEDLGGGGRGGGRRAVAAVRLLLPWRRGTQRSGGHRVHRGGHRGVRTGHLRGRLADQAHPAVAAEDRHRGVVHSSIHNRRTPAPTPLGLGFLHVRPARLRGQAGRACSPRSPQECA
jgi:hypothetical protein